MVAAIEHSDVVFQNADNTGWRCIAEYEGSTPALARKFIFGAYLDEPLALIDVDTTETIYYYHQNRLYNVAAMTDSSGNVVERYTFSAYGLPLILTGAGTDGTWGTTDDTTASASAIGNPYLYTGQRWDPETENHYYKNRYQRPTLGRFISRDQLEYVDGMSLYAYATGNPLRWADPLGLWRFWDWVWTGDGNATEDIERSRRQQAQRARELAAEARAEGNSETANRMDRLAHEADHEAATVRDEVLNAARDEFDRQVWDRTNGTLDGLTMNLADLSTLDSSVRDPNTGKAVTFDEEARGENRCYSACVADALLNAFMPNPTMGSFNPYQSVQNNGTPLYDHPLGPQIYSNGSISNGGVDIAATSSYTPQIASDLWNNYGSPPPVGPDTIGDALESLGDVATAAMFINDVANECREKCFCEE